MASLIHQITSIAAARYGVNILELRPPGQVQGESTNVIGIIADLPWGPVDEVTLITSPAELFDTFAPPAFGRLDTDFPALLAFINKTFPAAFKVVRIAATGQAVADFTFQDDDPQDSVTVSARYPGNRTIEVAFSANAETPANRDMRVKVGSYDVTYENVATPDGGLTVNDPGDPFVSAAAAVGGNEVPDPIGLTTLTGGSDGTAVIGDYTGITGSGGGLEEFADQNVDVDVIFGAEVPQPLVASWNAALKAFEDTHKKGMAVLSTDSSITTVAGAIADVPSYRSDRLVYVWPRVKAVNTYDPERPEVAVDGNAFAAVAIASVQPEVSPVGAPGAPLLTGITPLEITGSLSKDAYASLNDAGIAPWFNSTALAGFIIHRGWTTSITSGLRRIFRRRMTDFILLSLANSAEPFTGTLLDLDLPNKALGPNTSVQAGMWRQFLQDLQDTNLIRSWEIDEFGSNLQSNIDDGQWIVAVTVKLISAQEELVFLATIGENVVIEAA